MILTRPMREGRTKHRLQGNRPLITLKNSTPLAQGGTRMVYRHPEDPGLLVKIVVPNPGRRREGLARLIIWLYPPAAYRFVDLEVKAWRRLIARNGALADLPLPRTMGFVQTDLGRGQITEAIPGPDGSGLALTVTELARRGPPDAVILDALNRFAARLLALNIVTRDLSPRNVVLDSRTTPPHFVLVDGFGDKNTIPLRTLFRRINRRKLEPQLERLGQTLGLGWTGNGFRRRAPLPAAQPKSQLTSVTETAAG